MNPLSIQVAYSGKTRQFTLAGPMVTIGSAADCTLVLPFAWISSKHLEIEHGLLLSRIRTGGENCPATLDGYPITTDWSLLPKHGLIEIPSPLGGQLAIAVDLQPVAVATVTPAAPAPPPPAQVPFTAPTNLPLRSERPTASSGLLMKYVPLAIAALLLLGVVVVLFVINGQKPAPPSGVAAITPAPSTTTSTTETPTPEETPATEPSTEPVPTTAPVTAPVVEAPPPVVAVKPEPPLRVFRRRQATTAPATGPSQYALLEEETRTLLQQPTTAPLSSDLLRTHAYEQAKTAVSAQLKNATSIKFPDLESGQVSINFHDSVYIARGSFESTNAAGVPIRQAFYCRLRPTNTGWHIEQTEIFAR